MNDSSTNFKSILDESPDHVERRKPLPVGTYLCVVGAPRYDKSSKKKTPFVEFLLRPMEADDDVDLDELKACLTNSEGGEILLTSQEIRATYYTTEDAIYRLDEFHEHCGVNLSEPASRRTRNDLVVNAQVLAYVKHRTSEDGSQTFAELGRTLPVDGV